jgi:hypothetical protein
MPIPNTGRSGTTGLIYMVIRFVTLLVVVPSQKKRCDTMDRPDQLRYRSEYVRVFEC